MATDSDTNKPAGWELIWRGEFIPPRYRSLAAPNDTVVEWANGLPAGGFVLDVGCGIGRHCIYLGERGFRMAGVDVSPTGIQTTKAVCAERQIPFEGHAGDMNHLPWADGIFDSAFSTSTIHHHRRIGIIQTLSEIRRVLKPGGLLLADFPSTDTLEYQRLRGEVASGHLTEIEPNTFVDERPDIDESDDLYLPHHFADEPDLRDLLRSFEIIKLWADLRDVTTENGSGKAGRWIAWARKPL